MEKIKVTLLPDSKVLEVDKGQTLFKALMEDGEKIASSCGGYGSCSDCVVKITTGESNINAPTFNEIKLLGNVFHITHERLSCQCTLDGDITVDLTNQRKLSSKPPKKFKPQTKRRTADEKQKIHEERKSTPKPEKAPKQGGLKRPKTFKTQD